MDEVSTEVAALLERFGSPDGATEADGRRLMALMYPELRRLAGALMAREGRRVTLQPTALLHEAFVRLVGEQDREWGGRAQFLAVAARCMRRVLVDHARARKTEKRGGAMHFVTLDDAGIGAQPRDIETLIVHEALERFADLDPRAAQVAEMRIFGGLSVPEIADALDVSPRTVDGDWATARLWLTRAVREE